MNWLLRSRNWGADSTKGLTHESKLSEAVLMLRPFSCTAALHPASSPAPTSVCTATMRPISGNVKLRG